MRQTRPELELADHGLSASVWFVVVSLFNPP